MFRHILFIYPIIQISILTGLLLKTCLLKNNYILTKACSLRLNVDYYDDYFTLTVEYHDWFGYLQTKLF